LQTPRREGQLSSGTPAVCELFEAQKPEPDALVFSWIKGGPMRRSGFNKIASWPEAGRAIGMPGLHIHDLRHTGNMIAAGAGAGLKDLKTRMGHDNVRAAMIYQHAVRGADKVITKRSTSISSGMIRRDTTMTEMIRLACPCARVDPEP
jgi:integrase